MRKIFVVSVVVAAVIVAATAAPALAQEVESEGRPWHYWLAPFLFGGAVLALIALGVGYWVRVMGGRARR